MLEAPTTRGKTAAPGLLPRSKHFHKSFRNQVSQIDNDRICFSSGKDGCHTEACTYSHAGTNWMPPSTGNFS